MYTFFFFPVFTLLQLRLERGNAAKTLATNARQSTYLGKGFYHFYLRDIIRRGLPIATSCIQSVLPLANRNSCDGLEM